jgi:hypothetical protein
VPIHESGLNCRNKSASRKNVKCLSNELWRRDGLVWKAAGSGVECSSSMRKEDEDDAVGYVSENNHDEVL